VAVDVYPHEVRTTIEIDDDLLAEAQELAGTDTKRATIEYALRELVRRNERLKMLDLEGEIQWEGDLQAMRATRTFPR